MTQLDIILVFVISSWLGILLLALGHREPGAGQGIIILMVIAIILGFVLT